MSAKTYLNKLTACLTRNQRVVFLILSFWAGIWALTPELNFQTTLAQGDHGYNLYAFDRTAQGAVPYKDYNWPYGPLMPYYYTGLLLLFGKTIASVLLGQTLLILTAGILVYLTLAVFISPFLAFISAIWFWAFRPEFLFTYNHYGALTLALAALYYLFSHIKTSQKQNIAAALFCCLLIILIRPNMGIAAAAAALISWILTPASADKLSRKKKFFLAAMFLTSAVILPVTIYRLLTHSLPAETATQLPSIYLGYLQNCLTQWPVFLKLFRLHFQGWTNSLTPYSSEFFLIILILIFLIRLAAIHPRTTLPPGQKRSFLLALITTVLFALFFLHEYLIEANTWRLAWSAPFWLIGMFLLIGLAAADLKKSLLVMLGAMLFFIPLKNLAADHRIIAEKKNAGLYLALPKAQIYVGNSQSWINTVAQTADFLNQTLRPGETFLALPYEPLYYFLTGRESPSREVFLIGGISAQTEKEIIAALKDAHIRYVIVSNRIHSSERKYGGFGKAYGRELNNYIEGNFETVKTFGQWEAQALWAEGHAIKILARKR